MGRQMPRGRSASGKSAVLERSSLNQSWGVMKTRIVAALFALFLLSSPLVAQVSTSRITGVVTDKTGAEVPGAKVTATNEGTNATYVQTSSSSGVFVFDSLQIGTYTVSVTAKGFKTVTSTGNILGVGAPTTVNLVLEVGAILETVEVKGGYDLVQTDSSGNFGNVIDNKTVSDLPIVGVRGRNPLGFITLVPGVQDSGGAVGGGTSVNGMRDRSWNITLDGVDANETSSGSGTFSPIRTNPDNLSEFKVITGQTTAEYGRVSGGQVNMVTKSGTNQLHGTGFWFYQSPFLQANSPANKTAIPQIPRQQFVQNIYGGSVGGPIRKNKDFYFFNIQLLHALNTGTITHTVYTDTLKKSGIFRYVVDGRNQPFGASGASVDANGNPVGGVNIGTYNLATNDPRGAGLDPSIQKYLALAPSPNNFSVGDGLNIAGYTFAPHQLEKQVDLVFKIDHTFNDRNSMFVRWSSGHQNTDGDTANAGQPAFPGLPNTVLTKRAPRNMAINWRWLPTDRMTNELVLGLNRFGFDFANPDPNVRSNPNYNFNLVTDPLNSYISNARFLTTYQLADNLSMAKGAHIWKYGINFRYQRHIDKRGSIGSLNALPQTLFDTGTDPVDATQFKLPTNMDTSVDQVNLKSAINDLLGRVGQIQQGFVAKDDNTFFPAGSILNNDERYPEYDFYAQDSWKWKPNLTIDYGLRLDARMNPRLRNYPNLVPNQSLAFGLVPSNTVTWVPGDQYKNDWNNFGPSIGFAWDPFKDGKTSVRAHYRTAFDRINTFEFSSSVYQGMPGLTYQYINTSFGAGGGRVRDGAPAATIPAGVTPTSLRQLPAFGTGSITVADPAMHTPKVHMWGLSIQREVARNTVVTVSYNGSHGVGLLGGYDANQVNITGNGFLDAFNTLRPCDVNGTINFTPACDSAVFDKLFSADTRRPSTQTGSEFALRNFTSNFTLNSVAGLAQTIATRTNPNGQQLIVADGLSPFFFLPYPQFLHVFVLDSRSHSNYNGMLAQIERRFSNGLLFQGSFTWSKSLDIRSFDPVQTRIATGATQSAAATPFDIRNPRLNYGPSDFDHTRVFQTNWVYELPFGQKKRWGSSWNRAVDEILGGWEVAGNAIHESGRPFTIYSGSNTLTNEVQTPASCSASCSPYEPHVFLDSTIGQQFYLTSTQKAQLVTPAAGAFSNLGRNFFRLPIYANLNMLVSKHFKITERHSLETRLEMQNVTNSQMYDLPGSSIITSSAFVRANQASDAPLISSPRRMQLSLKYSF
jgi:hypothetical protein